MSPTITSPAMTQAGMILGTAAYMSPEQARGKSVDRRADIWAFGAVLYEMLTGKRAFAGEDVSDTLANVLKMDADWGQLPQSVPPRVRLVIRACLQKNARQRIDSAQDVRLALEGAFDSVAPQATATLTAVQPVWRQPLPVAAIAAVMAVLVMALGAWSLRSTPVPGRLNRFEYVLPEGLVFRSTGRTVMALSPDGRSFAFNTSEGLYIRAMGELNARLIVGTEGTLQNPFFSPDGQSVAYLQGNQLKRVPISGGAPVVIADTPSALMLGASWGADNTIFFGQPQGIMRVSARGGTPELVIRTEEGQAVHGPQLLPDSDSVLMSVTTGADDTRWDTAEIVVYSLSSGGRTVVLQGGSDARYLPTGHLVYALENGLFAVAFDPETLTTEGEAVPLVQGVMRAPGASINSASAHYGVSDEGTLVYVADTGVEIQKLVWVNRDGAAERIDTIPTGTTPRLSPDDGRVLLETGGDLWIYEVATGRSSRLTRDGGLRGAWDPTSPRVAYTSAKGGDEQAWVEPSDGSGEPRQLTDLDGGRVHVDSWSPDGRTLAVHQHTPKGINLLMVPVSDARAEAKGFLERDFDNSDTVFSPDGRYVAYRSTETGQGEVYIRPYPGPGGQQTVSVGGGQQPVWADNGELFYRDRTGERMIAVPVSTEPLLKVGTPRQLFQGNYYNLPAGGSPRPQYDVTADGKRFLMLETDATVRPKLIVVQNWLEELKRLVPTK